MPEANTIDAEGAAWRALLRRSDIMLAAFLDRGMPDDLEVLFASRAFLRLANQSPDKDVRGRSMASLLASNPECLETLRDYRPTLAGNSAFEWDCPWQGDIGQTLHRCVLIPFRATGLRGCLLAVDEGLPMPPPVHIAIPAMAGDHAIGAVRHGGEDVLAPTSNVLAERPRLNDGTTSSHADRLHQSQGSAGNHNELGVASGHALMPKAEPPDHRSAAEAPQPDAMEPEFWQAFVQIADECGVPIDQLWRKATSNSDSRDPRSAVRSFVLRYFQFPGMNHAT